MQSRCTNDIDDMLEAVQAMLEQEAKYYSKKHFQAYQMKAMTDVLHQFPDQKLDLIDASCRTKMCSWFQQICNFCQYDEDETLLIIENAMNFLDRYVVTAKGSISLLDRNYYQGMAITCLYMATKIHASAAISASDMAQITRYVYTVEQIEEMERHILHAIEWHVNPPTVSAYVSEFMRLLIAHLHESQAFTDVSNVSLLSTVKELIHAQTISAFGEESFITVPASIIAYISLRNAIQFIVPTHKFHEPFHAIQTLILANVPDRHEANASMTSLLHYFDQLLHPPPMPCPSSPSVIQSKGLFQPQRSLSSPNTTTVTVTL
jgi:hypothetical protein